jgi:CRISPR-associated protein Csb2
VIGIVGVRCSVEPCFRPPVEETLLVGEMCRRAIMSHYGKAHGGAVSPVLSGKDQSGKVLSGHQHAFYLADDGDGDGLIDTVFVYSVRGFNSLEIDAIARVREVYLGHYCEPMELRLSGVANMENIAQLGRIFGPSRVWISAVPYVMTRHPKRTRAGETKLTKNGRQQDGPEEQIAREWDQRVHDNCSLPLLIDMQLLGATASRRVYRIVRAYGNAPDPVKRAFKFKLMFDGPLMGPVALGYACHFGLGLFVPETATSPLP